jgi:hypothetical protein
VPEPAKLICTECGKETEREGQEIPTRGFWCRECCAGKSALDGKSSEEIAADPLLNKMQQDCTGAYSSSYVEYLSRRRERQRRSSQKYRKSKKGKTQAARRRLSNASFTVEQWLKRIEVDFQSKCYACEKIVGDSAFRVILKRNKDGSFSRRLRHSFPACESCKNKVAARSRWEK